MELSTDSAIFVFMCVILGVSLIVNIFFVIFFLKIKRSLQQTFKVPETSTKKSKLKFKGQK